jgi:hypothetical protein
MAALGTGTRGITMFKFSYEKNSRSIVKKMGFPVL